MIVSLNRISLVTKNWGGMLSFVAFNAISANQAKLKIAVIGKSD